MTSRVRRTGAAVCRPANFWTPAVHGLLRHLQAAGFPAPQPLGTEGDRELLTWIDGESGRVPAVYLGCTCARAACCTAGRDPSRRPVRRPLPARYIGALACAVPRRITRGT
jgi:hypothetical protein